MYASWVSLVNDHFTTLLCVNFLCRPMWFSWICIIAWFKVEMIHKLIEISIIFMPSIFANYINCIGKQIQFKFRQCECCYFHSFVGCQRVLSAIYSDLRWTKCSLDINFMLWSYQGVVQGFDLPFQIDVLPLDSRISVLKSVAYY